jgi:hypothetical protein
MPQQKSTKRWLWIALASAGVSMVLFAAAPGHARPLIDQTAPVSIEISIK